MSFLCALRPPTVNITIFDDANITRKLRLKAPQPLQLTQIRIILAASHETLTVACLKSGIRGHIAGGMFADYVGLDVDSIL